ncbi:hypothetical protein SCLCIDRAFT_32460 [Scleroderma citrinum Foug A]|uniref:Uncharacterized protein n=1 Tax=Scleroderma citrinum Foug A TaxID=1036808 RepID=A0A0C2YSH5_9AGAM|nr:hypothetical protein SCLCIDRAFT_32460 [Scleroderma citrinum Foug A]
MTCSPPPLSRVDHYHITHGTYAPSASTEYDDNVVSTPARQRRTAKTTTTTMFPPQYGKDDNDNVSTPIREGDDDIHPSKAQTMTPPPQHVADNDDGD